MLARYVRWLHTGWPAGTVEKLPEVNDDGTTRVPGVRVVGDLTGVPLLKFSADTGARAVQAIAREADVQAKKGTQGVVDVAIVGGGVSGIAAAMEAKKQGLSYVVFEASSEFSTIANFPKAKPIFTYPTEMTPAGEMKLTAVVKEALFDELEAQRKASGIECRRAHVERVERRGQELAVMVQGGEPVRALRVIIAIGRSGNYRTLGAPGEKLDKVTHRLYDPNDYAGQHALVVGGGDSAVETAVALAMAGADVTLAHRGKELSRPKPENLDKLRALEKNPHADVQIERPVSERVNTALGANMMRGVHPDGRVRVLLSTKVEEVRADAVALAGEGGKKETLANDVVFAMIGREAPLDFFRRSGIPIRGEWRATTWIGFLAFFAFCCFLYTWKADTAVNHYFSAHKLFPFNVGAVGSGPLAKAFSEAVASPGFYYSLAYCVAILLFGWKRIQRRKTPYVTRQTIALAAVQVIPLFLLPYLVLPWMGNAGLFDHGVLKPIGDNLFPDHSWWRAFGLVLAWPLFVWNFFNWKPLSWWLVIGGIQTFVLIPLIVRRWGKGAYCGWICSCGALAETMGDTQRQKMPHGPVWNRVNLVGQAILAICFLLFAARIITWTAPGSAVGQHLQKAYDTLFYSHSWFDYYHVVDMFLAGIVGVGMYFWFSGRVWCRFACPLAALMHIYARFSRFRIFADKKKCISCNVCTSVCHQGIDVMSFANKGMAMEDPECVRCSACVQSCPTGTLQFGRLGAGGAPIYDTVAASPVLMAESSDGKKRLRVLA
ncbi:MAG TPA: NAD(P)-binding domain-containing protein [Polyangia bacterium]|nr:NAD(P)-binding domain-containing protein [Polyangia bacterium]